MICSLSKVVLSLTLGFGAGDAFSRCVDVNGPGESLKGAVKRAMASSTAVFIGHVTGMQYVPALNPPPVAGDSGVRSGNDEMLAITMATSTWWKGAKSPEVMLHTLNYRHSGALSFLEAHEYPFEVGKTYLVYAHLFLGGLHANGCTRTKPIDAAASDIVVLNELKTERE